MTNKKNLPPRPASSAITPADVYVRRRELLRQGGLFAATSVAWGAGLYGLSSRGRADPPPAPPPVPSIGGDPSQNPWRNIQPRPEFATDEARTPFKKVTTYNNFYELGLSKSAPARNADSMKLRPWAVRITGEVKRELTLDVDRMVARFGLEERVYRMRCVEAWSMVIPWVGFELSRLIRFAEPTSHAKYVKMTTLLDREQLPGQSSGVLDWPYVEALRMDEAMNPLTLMAVGLYGAPLLGQNGAPLRLVVPWKYGFKGVKSIVEVAFVRDRPLTTWNQANGREYGFYANVNPEVDHPRWSQATERRLGDGSIGRIATKMYNGYGSHVAHLYRGMDLRRNF